MSSYRKFKKEQAKEIAGETREVQGEVFVDKVVRICYPGVEESRQLPAGKLIPD
jgi:hypothetical protein